MLVLVPTYDSSFVLVASFPFQHFLSDAEIDLVTYTAVGAHRGHVNAHVCPLHLPWSLLPSSMPLSSAPPLPLINDYKLISISLGFTLPPDSGEKLSLGTV